MNKENMSWQVCISLLSNVYIKKKLVQILRLEFIILLIISSIILLFHIDNLKFLVIVMSIIYILLLSSIIINCSKGHSFTYFLNEKSASYELEVKHYDNIVLKLISKIPSPYKQVSFLNKIYWKSVRGIIIYRNDNTIILKNKIGQRVMIFTDENIFDSVNIYIQEKCPRVYPVYR